MFEEFISKEFGEVYKQQTENYDASACQKG